MLALGLLVFALPVLVAYAQTAAIDSFNLAKAGLVAADGIVIDKDAISALEFTPRVGVQPTFTNKGSAVEVLPGITLTRNREFEPSFNSNAHMLTNPEETETEPRIFLASEYSLLGKAYLVAMVSFIFAMESELIPAIRLTQMRLRPRIAPLRKFDTG